MNILIAGGAGFIGSNFVRHIINNYPSWGVVVLDALTYAGNLENLKDIDFTVRYKFVLGDIRKPEDIENAAKGCDAIINFAAESHVDRSILGANDFITTNFNGLYNLLEYARNNNILLVQVSTDEVYGSIREGSFTEADKLNPTSPYSASKACGDLLALSYFKTFGTKMIVTRSSNNFGPYQFPEKFIPLCITNAIVGSPLPVYGNGLNVRDWLYVEDNCEAIDLVLHKGKTGEIYNIGRGNESTNLDVIDLLLNILEKPKSLVTFVKDRLAHDFRYSINCDKIKALGWQPRYKFEEAMEATVNWYKSNINWWTKLKEKNKTYFNKQYQGVKTG